MTENRAVLAFTVLTPLIAATVSWAATFEPWIRGTTLLLGLVVGVLGFLNQVFVFRRNRRERPPNRRGRH